MQATSNGNVSMRRSSTQRLRASNVAPRAMMHPGPHHANHEHETLRAHGDVFRTLLYTV